MTHRLRASDATLESLGLDDLGEITMDDVKWLFEADDRVHSSTNGLPPRFDFLIEYAYHLDYARLTEWEKDAAIKKYTYLAEQARLARFSAKFFPKSQ